MELVFNGAIDAEFNDACEIQLPSYIVKLSDDDIALAKLAEDKHLRIIAAGADPEDEQITLLTATNRVMIFDAKKFYIPKGIAVPSHHGNKVFLPNHDGRWPAQCSGFYIDADWMLKNSDPALSNVAVNTNYIHEDDNR
jgi:hypothetical protein